MTKAQTIYNFFSSFGIDAYPNLAEDNAKFPFLVYESTMGNAGDAPINIAVNLYYYTDSEAIPNTKVEEIAERIGLGGTVIHHDDGAIWIQRGAPWCIPVNNDDSTIKQKQLNISLIFM